MPTGTKRKVIMADENDTSPEGDQNIDPLTGGNQDTRQADTSRQEHEQEVKQEAKDEGKTLTQAEVDKIVADRVARERKKFADYDTLKKKASEYDKFQDSQKTELERRDAELAAAQVELQAFRVGEIRRQAASAAGLDPELAEFITAADEEEATAQAKKLAERMKVNDKRSPDFKQGARTTPPPQRSRDELLRGLAGF
jgi:hypothetical protein